MNLLPIPLLDGGHLLYSLEVLSGKAIPAKYLEMAQRGGFAVLMCLMAIVTVNDVPQKDAIIASYVMECCRWLALYDSVRFGNIKID